MKTVVDLFDDAVATDPDAPLVRRADGALTYGDVAAQVDRFAGALVGLGVTPGDRVAVRTQKLPEVLALYLATLRVGGVYLPLNTAYTGAELAYFIEDAGPRVVVGAPGSEQELDVSDVHVATLGPDGTGTLGAVLGSPAPDTSTRVEVGPDDAAAILYTSGTTGRSKGAVLTHRALASNCESLNEAWRFTADDVLIHALPLFHVHGLFVAANMTLTSGASMHWLESFDADRIVDLLESSSVLMGVPTFYTRLLEHPGLTKESTSGMRLFVSGSAPLTAETHHAWTERTGHDILERYGMTETGMMTSNPYDGERRAGTVGMPLPGIDVRVVDREDGTPLPMGEVGSIQVKGPNVFREYWNKPEKTAEDMTDDGYFVTGDVGIYDADGYLSIVGRDKDLIISGGYNVYPKEVEDALGDHPAVRESAVIGLPHRDLGEVPAAVVVLEDDQTGPSADDLLASLQGRLARFKQPRAVEFVPELPRNVMGKIQKAELRATYADLFTDR